MRTRNWSLRAKIISLLLVPLTTLVVMWALATAVTLGPGLDLLDAQSDLDNIAHPGQAFVAELQAERKATVIYLGSSPKDTAKLLDQRAKTDAAAKTFRDLAMADDAQSATTQATRDRLAAMFVAVDDLSPIRGAVDRGSVSRLIAFDRYTAIVSSGYLLFASLVRVTDPTITTEALALVNLARSREAFSQEDAVLSGALAAGPLSVTDIAQVTQLIGAQRYMFNQTVPSLNPTDRADFQALAGSADFSRVRTLENAIMTASRDTPATPVTLATWQSAYDKVGDQLEALELRVADRVVERSLPAALTIFGHIAVAGLLGLIAVIVTIVATARIGRSLIKRLAGLRQAALELAVDRLPRVVERLRQGEPVDVANDAPALPYGEDEIGQVGHAFNELQRTAVNSAIDEANVRRGLNEVFLNIARRSQTLLHRQLSILDRMERRADDPTELEDLFRVDHLATRMRRHAEDLVILAGASPGRGWRNPVPIVDVLRGAVSEVEDYARVSIRPMPEIALVGRSVGDVIHLLAELIENATSFSPPHTRVNIGGELVSHGFAVEIEDRGLGMSAQAVVEFNARLNDPPEFDPINSAQLGLFVVARLAARHGVKVQLRSSPYGGITAVALIPDELVVRQPSAGSGRPREAVAALPAAPASSQNGIHPGGASGTPHYRELPTGQQRAIAAPSPSVAPSFATPVTPPVTAAPVTAAPVTAAPVTAAPVTVPPVSAAPVTASPAVAPTVAAGPATAPRVPTARSRPDGRAPVKAQPRHARQEVIEPDAANGDGLPKRVRQTSLAPQLRDDPQSSAVSQSGDIATPGAATRSPEELRAMMTSFQSGMIRGRRDAEDAGNADGNDRAPGREAQ